MIVFMVEEKSMYAFLQNILPKLYPQWRERQNWLCIVHEGKNDLMHSVPRKLRAWNKPEDQFVILVDQHSEDCIELKDRLRNLCGENTKRDVLIRIVCRELEAWFLGDLRAVGSAYADESIPKMQERSKFRQPDKLDNASQEISSLIKVRGKVSRAQEIASCMDISSNRSNSFNVFVNGLRGFVR